MSLTKICLGVLLGVVGLAVFCFASPSAVQPIPVQEAQDLLIQLQNNPLQPSRSAGEIQAMPIETYTGAQAESQIEQYTRLLERPAHRDLRVTPLTDYTSRYLSLTDGARNSLDTPTCSLVVAPDTSLSYFTGITAGDAYKVWIDPADCPGCDPVYPFRVDSLELLLVARGWLVNDTVFIGIDVECARFDPDDPCRGPGQERCLEVYYLVLDAVTDPADTSDLFVWTVKLPFDGCYIDGPSFVGVWHLGHTLPDDVRFHPNVAFDGANVPPVVDCYAWSNLLGWIKWADTWVDPDPGYPALTIYGECATTPEDPIIPCPESCAQQRWTGGLAWYDQTTTEIYQWFGVAAPDLLFPYKPMTIEFSLYYYTAGAADDSVRVMVMYGCPRLGDICCAPMEVLCAGSIWLTRGSASTPTLLPVSLDLSSMSCCLTEDFWVGVAIIGIGAGDPIPSFLWTDDTGIPGCEQWLYGTGGFEHWPNGSLGWADIVLSGSCEDCLGDPSNNCPPYVPEILDCASATQIACGSVTLTGETNIGGNSNVTSYCCAPWDESGPETVYQINVPAGHYLTVTLSNIIGGDVDVFLLTDCDPASCIASGDVNFTAQSLPAGTYYVVVDGYGGDEATYDISFDCYFPCNATICNNGLGGPVTNSRYLDGEWDATLGTVYYMYYAGTGNSQRIYTWDVDRCARGADITWTSGDASTCRMLAVDPRGYAWTGTITNFTTGTGRLYRVNLATGAVLNTWTTIANLPNMRWSGCAFDPNHNHLWVFLRGPLGDDDNHACELDVSNPANPVVIQGPHVIPFANPYAVYSSGGADYAEMASKILIAAQAAPVDIIECFDDLNPAYAGPPPGPGITSLAWCPPDSNSLQGFGLAAIDNGNDGLGEIQMCNFTDAIQPHRVFSYPSPCPLTQCDPVTDLRINFSSGSVALYWMAPQTGNYKIYMSTNPNNDGDPDNGADPMFTLVDTVARPAGLATWTAPNITDTYRNYVVVSSCN